jgi:hypothetical protein
MVVVREHGEDALLDEERRFAMGKALHLGDLRPTRQSTDLCAYRDQPKAAPAPISWIAVEVVTFAPLVWARPEDPSTLRR